MSTKKEDRCWPGYEPVPGKEPHSQGSCRPKAESKSTPSEKQFKAKRKRQLDQWQKEHPGKRRQAAEHLSAPATAKKKVASKKSASKKSAAKKSTIKRGSKSKPTSSTKTT